jgi:3-deoxy-7-phosphoheptulonate synthase
VTRNTRKSRRNRDYRSAAILLEEVPLSDGAAHAVLEGRKRVSRILHGEDDRLVAVVGPCSIHDPDAGLEYAERLRKLSDEVLDDVYVVMRVYFEKPRTTLGWKGLINDPYLDETHQINEGLRRARRFLCKVGEAGLPCGTEFLDPMLGIASRCLRSVAHRGTLSPLALWPLRTTIRSAGVAATTMT